MNRTAGGHPDWPVLGLPAPKQTFHFSLWWNFIDVNERLTFPLDEAVQGKELVRIRIGNSLIEQEGSPSTPNANTTLSLTLLRSVFITIVDVDGRYCIQDTPALLLSYPRSVFIRERMFKGIRIDMERSFLYTTNPLVALKNFTTPVELLFK